MKESLICTAIKTYLGYLENQGKLIFHRNNSGAIKTDNRFFRFGKVGSPDFQIFWKNGQTIHLEVKNEKGKLSEFQSEYKAKLEKLGHYYAVVKSVDDLESVLRDLDII
jgi:hypothetical protein